MERFDKVIKLKEKIEDELEAWLIEYPFNDLNSECLYNEEQSGYIRELYALLKLKNYLHQPDCFCQKCNIDNYIIDDKTFDIMLSADFNIVLRYFLVIVDGSDYNTLDNKINDYLFEYELVSVMDQTLFEAHKELG